MAQQDEDRIMRVWTPILLRTILIVASMVLIVGLVAMATYSPGFYVHRFYEVRAGHVHQQETFTQMITLAFHGDPHSIMTVGLFVLTLVPLARVAFCFVLFVTERDYAYIVFTAYVLSGLIFGVLLGKIG